MEWMVFEAKDLDRRVIEDFEKMCGYQYPDAFKDIVMHFDGGTPEYMVYNTVKTKGRVFNDLISFDADDRYSIWNMIGSSRTKGGKWEIDGLDWRYVPFANDPFGNLICFDRTNDHVVFWNHENTEVEEVADSFTEFIDSLYESQYEY